MTIKHALKLFGLNDKEILVYLTMLPLGKVNSAEISQKGNIVRTTTKYICDQLVNKGIVEKIKTKQTSLYRALSPKNFISILNARQQQIEKKKTEIKMIIGLMKMLHQPSLDLPKIKFYTNLEDFKALINGHLEESAIDGEYMCFSNYQKISKPAIKLRQLVLDLIKQRLEKKIFLRMIVPDNEYGRTDKLKDKDPSNYRETRIYKEHVSFLAGQIIITKKSLYSMILEHNTFFGFSFTSPRIIEMFRNMFELAWESAEK